MKRIIFGIMLAILLGLFLVGCAKEETTTTTVQTDVTVTYEGPETPDAPADVDVMILGVGGMDPETVTIKAGGSLTWMVGDDRRHALSGENGLFRSGSMAEGDKFTFTFDTPGVYTYIDTAFGRRGTVIVE